MYRDRNAPIIHARGILLGSEGVVRHKYVVYRLKLGRYTHCNCI